MAELESFMWGSCEEREVSRMTPKSLALAVRWVRVPLMKVGGQEEHTWRKDSEFKFVYVNL